MLRRNMLEIWKSDQFMLPPPDGILEYEILIGFEMVRIQELLMNRKRGCPHFVIFVFTILVFGAGEIFLRLESKIFQ